MKNKITIGIVASLCLLFSVITVTSAMPAAGQSNQNIVLEVKKPDTDIPVGTAVATVRFNISPVTGCDPGELKPANDGSIDIVQPRLASADNASKISGLLNARCNWNVEVLDAVGACSVSVEVYDSADSKIGDTQTRAFILSGSPSSANQNGYIGNIRFANSNVAKLVATVNSNNCAETFTPSVTITGGTGVNLQDYAGLNFNVTYTPTEGSGCTAATTTSYTFNKAGTAILAQGSDSPVLLSRTLLMKTAAATPASISMIGTAKCVYTASFQSEIGNLRIQTDRLGNQIVTPSSLISGFTVSSLGTAGNAVTSISARYDLFTVPITVKAVFPEDEVFTTEERAYYHIRVNSPCGGFNPLVDMILGNADAAWVKVFPETITVYADALNTISNQSKSYSLQAYADAKGTKPCSVTVTQRVAPERCSVPESSQTMQYSAGLTSMDFVFTNTCEVTEVAVESEEESPPTPPEVSVEQQAATVVDGPAREGAGRG